MFCIKCGKKFEGEGYVCAQCQAAQAQEAVAPVLAEAAAAPEVASVAYTAPAAPAFQPPVYQAPVQPAPGFALSSAQDTPKKKGKKKGLAIGLAVLAVLLIAGVVLLALNWNKWFGGKDNLTVEVPEDPYEYIAFLHEPGMEELVDGISEAYGNYMSQETAAWDAQLSLLLGDDLLDMLETALAEEGLNMDTAWLKEIGLTAHWNAPDRNAVDMSLGLTIGKQEILTLDTVLDLKNRAFYMGLPELSDTYLEMDVDAVMAQAGESFPLDEMLAISAQLSEDMPSEAEVRALVQGLLEIVMGYMEDVEKSQQTVSAGKAEQEVTALTVTLTEEDLARLLKDLLVYVQENQAARKIAQAYVNYTNSYVELGAYGQTQAVSMEDVDDFLQEGIDTMEQLAQEAQPGNYLHLITYADGADILGYRFVMFDDGQEEGAMGCLALEEKGTVYLEANADQAMTITGQGKRSGGKLTGEYVLEAEGEELCTLKLKDVDLNTGYGTYELIPSAAMLSEMDLEDMLGTVASAFTVELVLSEGQVGAYLLAGDERFVGMQLQLSQSESEKVTAPKDTVDLLDEDALESWSMGLSLDQVLDNLKKAGLPKELYSMLKMLTSMV